MLPGPSNFDTDARDILDLLEIKVSQFSSRIALSIKEKGELRTVTYRSLKERIRRVKINSWAARMEGSGLLHFAEFSQVLPNPFGVGSHIALPNT
jgi:hypothetical protein